MAMMVVLATTVDPCPVRQSKDLSAPFFACLLDYLLACLLASFLPSFLPSQEAKPQACYYQTYF